jgi:hypothetical protein
VSLLLVVVEGMTDAREGGKRRRRARKARRGGIRIRIRNRNRNRNRNRIIAEWNVYVDARTMNEWNELTRNK